MLRCAGAARCRASSAGSRGRVARPSGSRWRQSPWHAVSAASCGRRAFRWPAQFGCTASCQVPREVRSWLPSWLRHPLASPTEAQGGDFPESHLERSASHRRNGFTGPYLACAASCAACRLCSKLCRRRCDRLRSAARQRVVRRVFSIFAFILPEHGPPKSEEPWQFAVQRAAELAQRPV